MEQAGQDTTTELAIPHGEYSRRLASRRARQEEKRRLYDRIANLRVAVVAVFVFIVWVQMNDPQARVLIVLPFGTFVGLVLWHARVSRACRRLARAARYYERRLACLNDQWAGKGEPGTRYLEETHPYAPDLDLFGAGCLFELLSTARTRTGEDRLAAWLLAPAGPDEIHERQAAIRELGPKLDLREEIALLGTDVPAGVDLQGLADWGLAPPVLRSRLAHLAALVLAAVTVASAVAWATQATGYFWVMGALLAEAAFGYWIRTRVHQVLDVVEKRARDLALFAGLLWRIEREPVKSPRLTRLRTGLHTAGRPPSVRISQLVKLIDWLNSQHNLFFAPLAIILLWRIQLAFGIDAWRQSYGPAVGRWLSTVAEFEALSSLAAYSYENPADPFPDLSDEGPIFHAEGLGHPLLPREKCVRNDVVLGGDVRVLLISGSNMSGKSTLLRTVGISTVMALAGAPVRAQKLTLSPLVVGATLRIQDSLQAGRSRFYTEITRIRQLLDLARGTPPLLFLLDELLQGTNSHDRRLGAEAVVRSLVEHEAIGMLTTHDLALTQIADLLAPRALNVHFEDRFEDGTMTFDYRMRPGVVQNSNALALMRAVGIEV